MVSQTKILRKGLWMMVALVGILVVACSKMDATYKDFIKDGEIRYSQKPDTLGISPGHNRVKAWLVAKRTDVSKFKIYWNDRGNSVEVPVTDAFETDTLSVIIDNIEEGSYTFEFLTFDREGNTSIVVDTVGYVYGDEYISSMSNRLISQASLIEEEVIISWYTQSNENAIRSEIRYKSQDGTAHQIRVDAGDMETVIEEEPMEGSIEYRTVFLPHPNAIDTFYTDYSPISPVHSARIYNAFGFPETFEDAQYNHTSQTTPANVVIGSGEWRFDKFITARGNAADRKNGNGAIRSSAKAQCIFEMLYDLPNGASKISFYHGTCSSDGVSQFRVEASQNQGATWTDISNGGFTNTANLVHREISIDIEGPVRFRFFKLETPDCTTAACRMNLDDITIYDLPNK